MVRPAPRVAFRCTTACTTSMTRCCRSAHATSLKSCGNGCRAAGTIERSLLPSRNYPSDMFLLNTHAARGPYDAKLQQVLSVSSGRAARERLASWPCLSAHPTPAWSLPRLAAALGVASLTVKDE